MKPSFPTIYHDGISIFLEFPSHVLRFPYAEGGLSKALRHVPNVTRHPGYLSGQSNIANRVLPKLSKTTKSKREIADFSSEQRNAASEVVRKMKVGES